MKRRLYEILEISAAADRPARLVHWLLVGSILLNVGSLILETVPELRPTFGTIFVAIELGTVALFLVEYLLRLYVADLNPQLRRLGPLRARLAHAVQPMALIDLLAILPPIVGAAFGTFDLGFAVFLRLVRFLKLARYSPGMRSLAAALASERRALLASALIMFGLIVAVATLMHEIEGSVQPEKFGSIPLAMYWAVTTLTTVGYGDVTPVTAVGKLLAGVTMVLGFTMFAMPVGIIATAFAREIRQRDFVVSLSMVARVPLFAELDTADMVEVMKLLRAQSVEAGAMVAYSDEPASSMYFIVTGLVEIDLEEGAVRLGEGRFFGEIAVLRSARRSADVIALQPTQLLVLDADDLHHLMHRRPEIGKRIRHVARVQGTDPVTPRGDISEAEIEAS